MSSIRKDKGQLVVRDLDLPLSVQIDLDMGLNVPVDIRFLDVRKISDQQRKFIFALCNEIAHYTGDDSEWIRMLMQQFNANLREIEVESLSKCSMSYANGLIDTIITHMIENSIPFRKDLLNENEYNFTQQQVYALTLKRNCVICGNRADIHHIDKVGMGNDRNKISHLGKRILPLCRTHHVEIHNTGDEKFMSLYHLEPIVVDKKLEHFIKKGTLKYYKELLE